MSEDIMCSYCKEKAKFDLQLGRNIYCEHCNYLKYDTSTRLVLCDLNCNYLYWYPCGHKFNKSTRKIKVNYVIEKDECSNCGKRDFQEAEFVGKLIYYDLCDFCRDFGRYKLKLDNDIICPKCKTIKHDQNSINLVICSTQCKKSPWRIVEYLTKKKNTNTKLIYKIENDECSKCKHISDSIGNFSGTRITELV